MIYSREEQKKKLSELYGRPITEVEFKMFVNEVCSLFEALVEVDDSFVRRKLENKNKSSV